MLQQTRHWLAQFQGAHEVPCLKVHKSGAIPPANRSTKTTLSHNDQLEEMMKSESEGDMMKLFYEGQSDGHGQREG